MCHRQNTTPKQVGSLPFGHVGKLSQYSQTFPVDER